MVFTSNNTCMYIWGFLKMGDPEVAMGFNTKMAIHDLDDLRLTPWIGNIHLYMPSIGVSFS